MMKAHRSMPLMPLSRVSLGRAGAVLLAAMVGLACTGQPSATEGSGAGVGGGTGVGGDAQGSGGQGAFGGALSAVLDDDGLVVRYYLDEVDPDKTLTEVRDAAPDPLNLTLTYVEPMRLDGEPGRRGIVYESAGLDGRASVLIDGTKVQQMLAGSTQATLEVVMTAAGFTHKYSRLLHIGFDDDSGSLTLSAQNAHRLYFFRQNINMGEFDVVLAPERIVLHAVLDTNAPEAEDRAHVFYNGSPAVNTLPMWPGLGEEIVLPDGYHLVIGNREIGLRSIMGTIHYAAMYNVALDPEQILRHAHVLTLNDDTPAAR